MLDAVEGCYHLQKDICGDYHLILRKLCVEYVALCGE